MIKLPDSLNSISRFRLLILVLIVIIFLAFLFGIYWLGFKKGTSVPVIGDVFYRLGIKNALLSVEPEEYVTSRNLWTYVEPNEETKRGYLIPGRSFKIVERKGEWARIEVYEPHYDMTWEGWIKTSDPGYQLKE